MPPHRLEFGFCSEFGIGFHGLGAPATGRSLKRRSGERQKNMSDATTVILLVFTGILLILAFIFVFTFGRLYIQALSSGCKTPISVFIGMWLRKVNPRIIIDTLIMATKGGLTDITLDKLEAHYMAKGSVRRVVQSLVAASKANIELTFDQAAAIDLAGRDVYEAVRTSVLPKVIDAPDPERGRATVDAVAGDGIQLRAKARVTVRTNLRRLVGGATEETTRGVTKQSEGLLAIGAGCLSLPYRLLSFFRQVVSVGRRAAPTVSAA